MSVHTNMSIIIHIIIMDDAQDHEGKVEAEDDNDDEDEQGNDDDNVEGEGEGNFLGLSGVALCCLYGACKHAPRGPGRREHGFRPSTNL